MDCLGHSCETLGKFPPPFFFSPKAKASGRKLRKVTLKVSPRGIILSDSITNEPIENISIYRYVSADNVYGLKERLKKDCVDEQSIWCPAAKIIHLSHHPDQATPLLNSLEWAKSCRAYLPAEQE